MAGLCILGRASERRAGLDVDDPEAIRLSPSHRYAIRHRQAAHARRRRRSQFTKRTEICRWGNNRVDAAKR
jgi:hypothetical protein